jgi:ABC-type nickel/cobalt efflux system permease component RcnA
MPPGDMVSPWDSQTASIERQTLSDQEMIQQPARSGMRICAWTLWIILILINYKLIIALWVMVWVMAASGWPNLR